MPIFEQAVHIKSDVIRFSGRVSPAVAPSGEAAIWYDGATSQLKFSVDGGVFGPNPGALTLADLTAMVRTDAPVASAAAAVLRLDSGTFAGNAAGQVLAINLGSGTADLINAQKTGADRFKVTETGIAQMVRAVIGGTTSVGQATITSTDTTLIPLVVRPAVASPTAMYFEIQNNTGSQTLVRFGGSSPFFEVTPQAFGFFYNGQISINHRMGATADTPAAIPFAARAGAGQTANLLEVLSSGAAILFAIEADGDLRTSRTTAATTPGTVVRKLELFDAAGASLGFVPLYNAIT